MWYDNKMEHHLTEADILSEMIAPDGGDFPPDTARALLDIKFTPKAVSRMNELAEKNRHDSITDNEKDEMEKYRRVGNFLSVVKAKARLSLGQTTK